ncbi:sulfur transferase domain-containing protein [Thalassotalea sp. G2M2-11]|uniref:fused DSP-PTPase phosphatase/NAD kinase-like protein n=1 Tax=Thalassotalea sp. G2M2-11 TaxID=2787627 RepID=UPI0019D1F0A2|nr:sulfur transferase domain-containing protein [Thalassotalea sp. G2M2-11]
MPSSLLNQLEMTNVMLPNEHLIVGSQPSIADLKLLKEKGVKTVVNLRPHTEANDFNEQEVVEQLSLSYCHIPVAGLNDCTLDACQSLQQILLANEPCLIHCATGNRVGALIALKSFWLEQLPVEQSIEYGKQAGLTILEAGVREIISA